MRRKNREIVENQAILEIIKRCEVCHVAFYDKEYPYVIPLNFGVSFSAQSFTLYFHCAKEGKKIELLQENQNVAFSMSCSHRLQEAETACGYTMKYESVCGTGRMEEVKSDSKIAALTILLEQYRKGEPLLFDQKAVDAVTVWKLTVHKISGKHSS